MKELTRLSASVNTIELLKTLPGGSELAAFLGDDIEFGDAEIESVRLDRSLGTEVVVRLPWKGCRVVFALDHWVDVQIMSFSPQNVIGGLRVRRAAAREAGFAEKGLGYVPSEVEIEFIPCAGAHGTISGRIKSIKIETGTDFGWWPSR